jgi:hypothetical protein
MYNEDTLERGVIAMKKQGLEQGRMIDPIRFQDGHQMTVPSDIFPDAVVGTVESGDFWYGDLDMSDLPKLHIVAKEIGESIKVYHSASSEPLTISV